ncbi:MAG TPA: hypothetical protein VNK45_10365 [Candidatus Acidoferrales bacterium]|nr:hypothetical protein [Candidatus Acidoferrales bacterium]
MNRPAPHAVPAGFAQAEGYVLIQIRLARLAQLFHSLDPAPFREKDLDPAADAYLVESAEEIGLELPIALVFELPATEIPAARALLPEALRNYFTARALSTRRALNRLLREGRTALVIGLVFLGLCLIASQAVNQWAPGLATRLLGEGLLIVGWVALWRPLEIFLYEWWPIHRRLRVHQRLAAAPVWIRAAPEVALSQPEASR